MSPPSPNAFFLSPLSRLSAPRKPRDAATTKSETEPRRRGDRDSPRAHSLSHFFDIRRARQLDCPPVASIRDHLALGIDTLELACAPFPKRALSCPIFDACVLQSRCQHGCPKVCLRLFWCRNDTTVASDHHRCSKALPSTTLGVQLGFTLEYWAEGVSSRLGRYSRGTPRVRPLLRRLRLPAGSRSCARTAVIA